MSDSLAVALGPDARSREDMTWLALNVRDLDEWSVVY